jgi:hypothetical protein
LIRLSDYPKKGFFSGLPRRAERYLLRPREWDANDWAGNSALYKLGTSNSWADLCFERGEVHFGHPSVSHEMAERADRNEIIRRRIEQGRTPTAPADDARQIIDFHTLGPQCLWVTFARGHLWWTFANSEVVWLGGDGSFHGVWMRKCIRGWRNTDIHGGLLKMNALSTRLTRVAAYRRTICGVESKDYLIRRINGVSEPLLVKAAEARKVLVQVTSDAIASLHWADFETLVDVVFARSGWHRTSHLGGRLKTIDMAIDQPTTGERAAVQVKSTADQASLDEYIARIDEMGTYSRLFFICHTPSGNLSAGDRPDAHVWDGRAFAETVVRLGLQDWVLEKIA